VLLQPLLWHDHLLLWDFGPYVLIFMNLCVVTTIAVA
jgi:hypothetical protein